MPMEPMRPFDSYIYQFSDLAVKQSKTQSSVV